MRFRWNHDIDCFDVRVCISVFYCIVNGLNGVVLGVMLLVIASIDIDGIGLLLVALVVGVLILVGFLVGLEVV